MGTCKVQAYICNNQRYYEYIILYGKYIYHTESDVALHVRLYCLLQNVKRRVAHLYCSTRVTRVSRHSCPQQDLSRCRLSTTHAATALAKILAVRDRSELNEKNLATVILRARGATSWLLRFDPANEAHSHCGI